MCEFVLSTGNVIHTEDIERAEYYSKNSLDRYGCHFGGPDMRRSCPFLFLQLRDKTLRVTGEAAEKDALALESAGTRVIRHQSEIPN